MDIKQILFLLVRHLGSVVVVWLAATGNISEDQATSVIVGVAGVIVTVVWSFFNKVRTGHKIETALELPAGSSKATLEDVLNRE